MRKNDNTASAVQRKAYKISVCAVLTALALIFSYVEALFPFQFGIPGMKLGLSNLVVLVALYGIVCSFGKSGADFAVRFAVRRSVSHDVQSRGRNVQLYHDASAEKDQDIQSSRSQHGRRRDPQYRSADRSGAGG